MKTAIITGGSGAIGAALVREFSADHQTVFTYRTNEEKALELAEETGATPVRCDITESAGIAALSEYMADCTLLINNAGISQIKLFGDMTDDEIDNMVTTDLTAVLKLTRDVSRHMVRAHRGCIINISSVWGVRGASCEVAYSAAKAGIIGFTKALAKELGPSGIRVNCIAPGVIESPMNAHLSADELDELIDSTPLMAVGKPHHVAHAARFIQQNPFITGQTIGIDGGFCI